MAIRTPQKEFGLDKAPEIVRKNAVDMLLNDKSTRDVSKYLASQGLAISHTAVAHYKKIVLRPALEAGNKLQQIEQLTASQDGPPVSAIELTKKILLADPLLDRVKNKYKVNDEATSKALQVADLKAVAALQSADTRTMDLEARLTGRLNSGPTFNNVVQLVISQTPIKPHVAELTESNTVDIDVVALD